MDVGEKCLKRCLLNQTQHPNAVYARPSSLDGIDKGSEGELMKGAVISL